MTKFVLYGGKGGVGKTTMAAATALALADEGAETLVVSTDPAHSLSDAFETELSGQPTELEECLNAAEIDPEDRQDVYRELAGSFAAELREVGIRLTEEDVEDLFLTGVAPGGDELAALDAVAEYAEDGRWEYVVLDTAPTGHTLRLLELPTVLETAMDKALKVRGQVRTIADSARRVVLGPYYYAVGRNVDDEPDEFSVFKARMERAGGLLRDPARTEFRVVSLPESMVIRETERLVDRLGEYDVPVRTLLANRVLENIDERCSRCVARRATQQERLREIRRSFPTLEIWTLPALDPEVEGRDALVQIADRLVTEPSFLSH